MNDALEKLERHLIDHRVDFDGDNLLLREIAYKRLYDALKNMDLEPGEPLSTVWLSEILGISRTPVREALQRLATDGLIQMIQGRAVTVAARSPQEVYDALHVRELLEPENVRLCATGMPQAALNQLHHIMERMEQAAQAGDRVNWSQADQEWHEIICESCPNKLLGQMVMQARSRMYHRGSDELVPPQYIIEGTKEHKQIFDAITNGDGDRAAELMFNHLEELKENLFKRFMR